MSTCEIFTYEPIDACSLLYLSKFKYRNKDSSFKFSLSLSGGISLDVGTLDIDQTANNNEWDVFKTRGLHFVHSNKTSFLHKIEKLHRNAAALAGILESKLFTRSGNRNRWLHSTFLQK